MPWIAYLLSVIQAAYDELGERVDELKGQRGAKTALVKQAIDRFVGDFSVSELQTRGYLMSEFDLIRKVLKEEKAVERIISLGRGRSARWRKVAPRPSRKSGTDV